MMGRCTWRQFTRYLKFYWKEVASGDRNCTHWGKAIGIGQEGHSVPMKWDPRMDSCRRGCIRALSKPLLYFISGGSSSSLRWEKVQNLFSHKASMPLTWQWREEEEVQDCIKNGWDSAQVLQKKAVPWQGSLSSYSHLALSAVTMKGVLFLGGNKDTERKAKP